MSTTFAKEEMIQASQFRTLSQKALREQLESHEKIGVLFPNSGLDAVLLSYERYAFMAERLAELEEIVENALLVEEFGGRFKAPEEQWVEHPEGVSTMEIYQQRRNKKTTDD